MNKQFLTFFLAFAALFVGVSTAQVKIDYKEYKLQNGLRVILHHDKSDPITAVSILYHVGSNREEVGKTGFAHLFEHMMFQESQHVPQDKFFKYIQEAGGTLNGGTWQDGTIYYQIVPNNALEMVLWMEADRMGWLLPTVTPEAFANQQMVVKNEKRQRVDNQPYGHTSYSITKLLYPEGHPYSWEVIGSLEDLKNATVEDVKNFYRKWYGPNNATIVIAGDFDEAQTREWVEKYFGEIKPSAPISPLKVQRVSLGETKKAMHEDNFANAPELNMVFPTVEQYSKESYALDYLGYLLSDGKNTPFYKTIVEEKKLAPSAAVFQSSSQIAGDFNIRIRTFPTVDLDSVLKAIEESFVRFEKEKFTAKDLERVKAQIETSFYGSLSSNLSKAQTLANYAVFAGSVDYYKNDLDAQLSVTAEDIWAVYNKYIKNKNYVLTSFVPKGKPELAVAGSSVFPVVEEAPDKTEEQAVSTEKSERVNLPSSFDRNVKPAFGKEPLVTLPTVWENSFPNGLKLLGITQNELPLVQLSIVVKGGAMLVAPEKAGVANLFGRLFREGTASKTPLEFEDALKMLGSSVTVGVSGDNVTVNVSTLKKNLDATIALVNEMLLTPRFDSKEFDRIKQQTSELINRGNSSPPNISAKVFDKLMYGSSTIAGYPIAGTKETVSALTLEDVKSFYNNYFSPSASALTVAGNITKEEAVKVFKELGTSWKAKQVNLPGEFKALPLEKSAVYFVDVPGAKQTEIRIGGASVTQMNEDFAKLNLVNYALGGSFNGILNLILREEKGYTYGARSGFNGSIYTGSFVAASGVQSSATYESGEIFRDEMKKYRNGISDEQLSFTKNALIKSNALRFETIGALNRMLGQIALYNLPFDYAKRDENLLRSMTLEEHKAIAQKYINPEAMIYLFVGDAATQMEKLKQLGFGDPILLDREGNPVK